MNTSDSKQVRRNTVPLEDVIQFILSSPHEQNYRAVAAACMVSASRACEAMRKAKLRNPDAPAFAGIKQTMPFDDIVKFILGYEGKVTVSLVSQECRIGNRRAIKAIGEARKKNPRLNAAEPKGGRGRHTAAVRATLVQRATRETAAKAKGQRRNQHTAKPFEEIVQYALDNGCCLSAKKVAAACHVGEKRASSAIRQAKRLLASRTPVLSMQPARPCRRELHYVVGDTAYRCSRYRPDWPPGGHFAVMEIGSQPGVLPVAESA